MSATTLLHADFGQSVTDAISRTGADPARLRLEITETVLLDYDDRIRSIMEDLAALGVRWYVDDFGTGYSSISHVRDLPVAGLKLDLSFTAGIRTGDRTSERLALALAGLAAGLGLETIAEGVETREEAAVLRAQGWKHAQGWLYGRAQPAATP